jgi:hypothetical protein
MVYKPLRRYITEQKHPGQNQSNQKTDLGLLHHFLGIHVTRDSRGLFLSQHQYILDLIQKAGMTDYQPSHTLVDTSSKLSATGEPFSCATLCRSITGTWTPRATTVFRINCES